MKTISYYLHLASYDEETILLFVILVFVTGIAIYSIVLIHIQNNRRNLVLEKSEKIRRIDILNRNYIFIEITPSVIIKRECSSKKDFERFDLDAFFYDNLSEKHDYYDVLINNVESNISRYQEYKQQYEKIVDDLSIYDSNLYNAYHFFRKIELNICKDKLQTPVTDLVIIAKKEYTSPQGRNHYEDEKCFDYSDIKKGFVSVCRIYSERNDPKFERSIMSASLRYDILKRDGFRCVLCGASANDGVKLEVDHIFPIAKGGKTEPGNLRTLCELCNRGKGAKYDYNGDN